MTRDQFNNFVRKEGIYCCRTCAKDDTKIRCNEGVICPDYIISDKDWTEYTEDIPESGLIEK